MILGLLVRYGLGKCQIPEDAPNVELAKRELNFLIQDLWYKVNAKFRQSRAEVVTVAGADEYVLNKYFDGFVKNSFQGPSSNTRDLIYKDTEEFFRLVRLQEGTTGSPLFFTFGDMVGYDQQLLIASKIRAFSSLASKTTGSVNFDAGSDFVTSNSDLFTLNDVGQRIRKSGDSKAYKISTFINARKIQLLEKYRGVSQNASAYAIGDIGIYVNIQGFISGELESENIELNGSNVVTTVKTFNSIVSITKSDQTNGKVSVQNEAGTQTIGTLAAGQTDIERQTILLWPKPDGEETLKYRFYMKHPYLWSDTDRPLLQEKWHRLLGYKLELSMRESFGKEVPSGLVDKISIVEDQFENDSEDLSMTDLVPDEDGRNVFGDRYYYDKTDL